MNEGHMPDSRNRTSEIGSILSVRLRAQNGRLANDLVGLRFPKTLVAFPFLPLNPLVFDGHTAVVLPSSFWP